jgi:hypothetical protein
VFCQIKSAGVDVLSLLKLLVGLAGLFCSPLSGKASASTSFVNDRCDLGFVLSDNLWRDVLFGQDLRQFQHMEKVNVYWQRIGPGVLGCIINEFPVFDCCVHDDFSHVAAFIAPLCQSYNANRGYGTAQSRDSRSQDHGGIRIEMHVFLMSCGGIIGGQLIGLLVAATIMKCIGLL